MNYGEDLNEVKTLLLTHEHSDHTIGLKMLLKHHVITDVYMTKGTMDGLAVDVKEMIPHIHVIKSEDHFNLLDLDIQTFMISHDANEPVGFVVKHGDKKSLFCQ